MIKSEVIPCLQDAMQTLQNIWSEIGLEEEQKEERTKSVLFHLRSLLQQMVSEEEELKSTLQANVETCTQELEKLSKELGLPMFKVSDVKIGFPDTCNQHTDIYFGIDGSDLQCSRRDIEPPAMHTAYLVLE